MLGCMLSPFKSVVIHSQHHGLKLQWLDAFQPPSHPISRKTVKSDKDAGETALLDENVIGIILEDDLEVIHQFIFTYIWMTILLLYFIPSIHSRRYLIIFNSVSRILDSW